MRHYNMVAFLVVAVILYAIGFGTSAKFALVFAAIAELGFWVNLFRKENPEPPKISNEGNS